jgi:lipid-A-disaccharide synthase
MPLGKLGPRVMLSCGEASGDLYAGALVSALREVAARVDVFGFGGARMATAGADLVGDYRGFSVTGLVEALSMLPKSWRMLRTLADTARRRRPDVFVAIDFPDFNFRLLPILRRLGVPIVYYVSPQLWAWRAGRLATVRRYVDRMLVIFPFEQAIYQQAEVPVEFVGHPLVDLAVAAEPRDRFLHARGLDPTRPVLALLPGSRPNELRQILPTLVDAVRLVVAEIGNVQIVVARAPSLESALFGALESLRAADVPLAVIEGATDDVLASADVVVTASGTATIQAALHQRPMVVVYRLAPLTYAVGKRFVRVKTYGMVNLVAGHAVVPELIQHEFTAHRVAQEAVSLLTDRSRAEAMRCELAVVKTRLGRPGASRRAAEAVLAVAAERGARV